MIAQQLLISYRQLSRLRKSATAAGLSHRSCTVSCVGWLWQLNKILRSVVPLHTPDKHLTCHWWCGPHMCFDNLFYSNTNTMIILATKKLSGSPKILFSIRVIVRWNKLDQEDIVRSGVQLSSWHGAALPTSCHSACCWSNVAPLTAVCIVIRSSCGASNTSFIAWRPSLCSCWTTINRRK